MSSFVSDMNKQMFGEPTWTGTALSHIAGTGVLSSLSYLGNKYSEAMTPKIPEQKMPSVPTAAQDAATQNTAAKEAARLEAERIRKRRGSGWTIMTGQKGIEQSPNTLKTTLG